MADRPVPPVAGKRWIVTAVVEDPLEPSGFTEQTYRGGTCGFDGELVESRECGVSRFLHYGPFDREADAQRYAEIVEGGVHELIAPVTVAKLPDCDECEGSGFDYRPTHARDRGTPCPRCAGTGKLGRLDG